MLNHGELIYKDSIEATMQRFPDEASLEDIYVRVEDCCEAIVVIMRHGSCCPSATRVKQTRSGSVGGASPARPCRAGVGVGFIHG